MKGKSEAWHYITKAKTEKAYKYVGKEASNFDKVRATAEIDCVLVQFTYAQLQKIQDIKAQGKEPRIIVAETGPKVY